MRVSQRAAPQSEALAQGAEQTWLPDESMAQQLFVPPVQVVVLSQQSYGAPSFALQM